jgi:hypothetical protein
LGLAVGATPISPAGNTLQARSVSERNDKPGQANGFAPLCSEANRFCKDNDTQQTAYGPVGSGWSYSAYPDDLDDWYYFVLDGPRMVSVELHNYRAEGDLVLYKRTATGGREQIANWGKEGPEMEIPAERREAGTYYVRVYIVGNETSTRLYELVVHY